MSFAAVPFIYQAQRVIAKYMPNWTLWFEFRRSFVTHSIHLSIVRIRMNHPNHPGSHPSCLKGLPKELLPEPRGAFFSGPEEALPGGRAEAIYLDNYLTDEPVTFCTPPRT